jgi:hypothetical protein
MGSTGTGAVSFLNRRLPDWVDLRVVVIPPGAAHPYEPTAWRGRLIVVERGTIELEFLDGRRLPCDEGYIGILMGLSLRALCNHHPRTTAVITGVARRRCPPGR